MNTLNERNQCDVWYFSDMQKCLTCGQVWDANDPYPPTCKIENPQKKCFVDRIIAFLFGTKTK